MTALLGRPAYLSGAVCVERRKVRGGRVGKKKVKSEEELKNLVLPVANDVIGIAKKMLGNDRLLVSCQDGKERLCRIR